MLSSSSSLSVLSLPFLKLFSPYAAQKPNSPHGLGRFFSLVSHLQASRSETKLKLKLKSRFNFTERKVSSWRPRLPARAKLVFSFLFLKTVSRSLPFSFFYVYVSVRLFFEPVLTGLCVLTLRCPLKRKKELSCFLMWRLQEERKLIQNARIETAHYNEKNGIIITTESSADLISVIWIRIQIDKWIIRIHLLYTTLLIIIIHW